MEAVITPHEHDVLCGRGGLTNHHPGNEWYRRLVRSNRPLYRACPKHTKLLVSKAIVQAVENQEPPGRFLECSKANGMWYTVTYKKAVDKTSQALREREKDEPNMKVNALPPSLQPKDGSPRPNPDLNALAKVALATAGLDQNKEKSKTPSPAAAFSAPVGGRPTESSMMPSHPHLGSGSKRPLEHSSNAANISSVNGQYSSRTDNNAGHWFAGNNSSLVGLDPAAKKLKMENTSRGFAGGGVSPLDPVPLPTAPLQARQSSMFRFLNQSRLLGSSEAASASQGADGSSALPPHLQLQWDQMRSQADSYPLQAHQAAAAAAAAAASSSSAAAPPLLNSSDSIFGPDVNSIMPPGLQVQTSTSSLFGGGADAADATAMPKLRTALSQFLFGHGGLWNPSSANAPAGASTAAAAASGAAAAAASTNSQSTDAALKFPATESAANNYPTASQQQQAPPPLARLQTQVSDWLTAFWPVRDGNGNKMGPATRSSILMSMQSLGPLTSYESGMGAGLGAAAAGMAHGLPGISGMGTQGGMGGIGGSGMPVPRSDSSNIKDSIPRISGLDMETDASTNNNTAASKTDTNNSTVVPQGLPAATAPPSRDDNRNVAGTATDTSNNKANSSAANNEDDYDSSVMPAPPTEVERTVSATLLSLASSPSNLFSGFSTLFGKENNAGTNTAQVGSSRAHHNATNSNDMMSHSMPGSGATNAMGSIAPSPYAPPPPPPSNNNNSNMPPAPLYGMTLGRPSKSSRKDSSSLLDDYEESPMETRLRTVTSR